MAVEFIVVILTITYFSSLLFRLKSSTSNFFLLLFLIIFSINFSFEKDSITNTLKAFVLGVFLSLPILFIDLYSKTVNKIFFPKLKSIRSFLSLALFSLLLELDYFSYIYSLKSFNIDAFNMSKIEEINSISFNLAINPLSQILFLSLFLAVVFIYLTILSKQTIPKSFIKVSSLVIMFFVFVESLESYSSIYKEIVQTQNVVLKNE